MKNYRVAMMNKRDYNNYMSGGNSFVVQFEVWVEADSKEEALRKANGYRGKVATYAVEL